MTTKSTITTRKPAEETAAAVSSPDIAEATESPANTRRMMKRITIPRGVLITPMIEPVDELLPIQRTSQKTEYDGRGEANEHQQNPYKSPGV